MFFGITENKSIFFYNQLSYSHCRIENAADWQQMEMLPLCKQLELSSEVEISILQVLHNLYAVYDLDEF